MKRRIVSLLILLSIALCLTPRAIAQPDETGPALLTFDEMVQLYQQDVPERQLQAKLDRLLTTPFVSNKATASGVEPLKPSSPEIGKFLRVAQWNIERGLEFDAIKSALADPALKQADVVVLNEVDWGINRTRFRNVVSELAEACGMNYAYGVEFVEIDPATMGLEPQAKPTMTPDPARYHGLHGTAVLSRYPLKNVRLVPFKFQGHDWYRDEKKKASKVARVENKLSNEVFKEPFTRQVRRGGRMMLFADITDPEFPSGRVTIVATHLEDMTSPANRRKQLVELLDQIRTINHPVVVAGDMNTSTHDAAPVSVTQALKQRFGSGKWWVEDAAPEVVSRITPFGWAYELGHRFIGFARGIDDPTVRSNPLLGNNPEAAFFKSIESFHFADGSAFDFRGEAGRSTNGRSGNLSDSNERSEKGFTPTSELRRTFGPIGKYKLDWIFVRPAHLIDAHGTKQSYRFAPHFGHTWNAINDSIPDHISDHSPITVDLPLTEPRIDSLQSRRKL
jgi:endonuclease/exonuclease/phosphatase family metal-dependent hydrolase